MSEQPSTSHSIRDAVMDKIRSGSAAVRPRWHFVLLSGLVLVGSLAAFLALIFLASFVFFTLDRSGAWFLPSFGARGLWTLLSAVPWLIIIAVLAFIAGLEFMALRFRFVYRRPLLYSLAGVLVLAIMGALLIGLTPLHDTFNAMALRSRLPFVGGLYRSFGPQHTRSVHIGTITAVTSDGFTLSDRQGNSFSVVVGPKTVFPSGVDFVQNDRVIVLGPLTATSTIEAMGVSSISASAQRSPTRVRGWYFPPQGY